MKEIAAASCNKMSAWLIMAGNPAQQRLQQDMHAYYKGDISTRKLVAGMLHRRDLHTLSAFARRQLKTRALPGVTPLQ